MFKLAQVSSKARTSTTAQYLSNHSGTKLRLQQMQQMPAVAQRSIKNPSVSRPKLSGSTKDRRSMYDMYGKHIGRLGVLFMNKEHRFNTLSPSFSHEVSRGIGSMYEDRLTRAIFISTAKGKHWSNGTDFRTMLHMKNEGNQERLSEYLEQIYQLQTQVAKTNKPIVAIAPGHAFNSGATLLASCGLPSMTVDSKMAFNECTFGFVPHSGATYYLSRLPDDFGTFLALTGMPIHGTDAAQLKLVDTILQTTLYAEEDVSDAVYSQGYDPREDHAIAAQHEDRLTDIDKVDTLRTLNKRLRGEQNEELSKHADHKAMLQSYMDKSRQQRGFEEAHERIPSSVALAEGEYNKILRGESIKHQNEGHGYLEYGGPMSQKEDWCYQQIYRNQAHALKQHIGQQFEADRTVAFQHREMIGRCFYSNTIEEIMHNLRQEDHPFARKCLEAMERNSDLSMRLALKMLRQATNLDYARCLKMEVNVASSMIETKEFDIGVQQVLMTPKARGQKHPNAAKYPDKPSMSHNLDSYFEGTDWAKNISVGAMSHALLPTRHYYERFTDQVRLWINEESTHQDQLRSFFDYETKEALQEQGIDVRDKGLTMQSAREHLAAKLAQERRLEVQNERAQQLLTDSKLQASYFDNINKEVSQLRKLSKTKFQSEVDSCITKVFENAYIKRMKTMFDKSKEAQSLERRRMFIRMKRFLFRSRCVTEGNESTIKQIQRMENYSYKLPHMTENWEKSWRDADVQHPQIVKSPLFHLSKAIGRMAISPIELTKEYMTNPQMREKLSMLTVDKKELLKLQEDVYANPQKYEEIFNKQDHIEWGQTRHFWFPHRRQDQEVRLNDNMYWHSMLNDGTNAVENWPYYRQYMVYKDWFEEIEKKALNTLKVAIAQLLADFDDDKKNPVFDGTNMTKRGQMEHLMSLIESGEQQKGAKKQQKKQKASQGDKKAARKITSTKRDLNYIDRLLDDTVSEDVHLQKFLDPVLSENHPMIAKIQGEARAELLKMLEIVLLDKYHDSSDKEEQNLLKQRLATLMMPSGMSREDTRHQQLKVIDSHLLKKTGKDTLKSAIDLIKPMYLTYVDTLLSQAGITLLEQLKLEDTHDTVLLYHHLNKRYPEIERSPALQRFLNYSKKRENVDTLYKKIPTQNPTFKRKNIMDSFGVQNGGLYMATTDIEEQKLDTKKQMERQLQLVKTLEANIEANEKEWAQDTVERNKNFISATIDEDVRLMEFFWSERDSAELENWEFLIGETQQWLDDHKYEIQNHFTTFDWLKVYSEAMSNYGLNMNQTFNAVRQQTEGEFSAKDKSDDEWAQILEVAKYLVTYKEAASKAVRKEQLPEITEFLSRQVEMPENPTHASLWQQALSKKNEFLLEQNRKTKANRTEIIRTELADFNRIQSLSQKRDQTVVNLERLVASQPARMQDLVAEALNSSKTYVDFEKLVDQLKSGEEDTSARGLSSLINIERLISDVKAKNGPASIQDRLLSTSIDVHSIEDAKVEAERDSSLSSIEKAQIQRLIEHVSDQMEYVSNSQRQALTFGQFLSDHHFSSPSAYVDYASNVLQKKLAKTLGEPLSKGDIVDWEVDGVRTSPIDHSSSSVSPAEYLQTIADGSELVQDVDERVNIVDFNTGTPETRALRDHAQIRVLRDAKQLTKLPNDMEQYKNYYENKLLEAMMKPGNSESAQSQIIDEYTSMRFKTCMLKADFAEKVRESDNGHLYLKVLREQVVDELGLTVEPQVQDMLFKTMYEKGKGHIKYDIDSMYNMQDVNNTQAMGYDNLSSRQGATDNGSTFENSHENVFDKLLADYYLSQRGDYAESNKLMRQLTDVFETKQKQETQYEHVGSNLHSYKQRKDMEKTSKPFLDGTAGKKIFDLDVLTQQAIQKGKSGLSDDLRKLSIAETEHDDYWTTQVPEFFEVMDVRKKPKQYVEEKVQEIVNEAFEVRRKLERKMSRRELIAFDKVLSKYLEPDNVLNRVEASIATDYSMINHGRQMHEHNVQMATTYEESLKKEPNNQRSYNRSIKDQDALYKQMAYGAIVEMKYKHQMENRDTVTFKDHEYKTNPYTFERWYMGQLELDAKAKPRPINESDYEPKKFMRAYGVDEPVFLDERAREKQFFEDHSLFMENKKEQQDRTSLFYVLEQFYEHSRENPDKMSVAQDHLKDYFSDPDNTFFFDKNKIQ